MYRFFAGLIILSLILPPQSAWALRAVSAKESAGLKQLASGLEERIGSPDSDATDAELLRQLDSHPQTDSAGHPYMKTLTDFHSAVAEPLLKRNSGLTDLDRDRLIKTVLPGFRGEIRLFDLSFLVVPVRLNTDGSIDIARQVLEQAPADLLINLFTSYDTAALLRWAEINLKQVTPSPAIGRLERFVAGGADRQAKKKKTSRPSEPKSRPADTLPAAEQLTTDLFLGDGVDLADTLSSATLELGLQALLRDSDLPEPPPAAAAEPALPPPVPGTVISSSGQLKTEMARRVRDLHAGIIPDNMVVMTGNGFDQDQIKISVGALPGAPIQTEVLILPGLSQPGVFLPDPRTGSASSLPYRIVWDPKPVLEALRKNVVLEEMRGMMRGDIQRAQDSMPWLNRLLDTAERLLADQGEEARIQNARAAQPKIDQLLKVVSEKEEEFYRLYGRLSSVLIELKEQADENGEIPSELAQARLQELATLFSAYPRAEYGILDIVRTLPQQDAVSLRDIENALSGTKVFLQRNHKQEISGQLPAEIILNFYHDAKRIANRRYLQQLKLRFQAAGEDPSDSDREAVSQFALAVLSEETGHLISNWISSSQDRAGSPAHPLPVSVLGVGFLNAQNQMRFIPGGLVEYDIPAQREFHWSADRVLPSYQAGDRIVLMLPSHTGGLTQNQFHAFFEGWFYLMNENPEIPEILLAIAEEDGSIRLLRPRIPERGKEAWATLARISNEINACYQTSAEWISRMKSSGSNAWLVNNMRAAGSLLSVAQKAQSSDMSGREWWIRRFRVSELFLAEVSSLFGPDAAEAVREQWKADPRHAKTLEDLRDRLNLPDIEQKRPREVAAIRQRVSYIGRTPEDLGYVFAPLIDLAVAVVEERQGVDLLNTPWMFEEVPLFPNEPKPEQKKKDWFAETWALWKKEDRFRKNPRFGKAEDAEPFARTWVAERVAKAVDGKDPEFKWIDFSKALEAHRKQEARRREEMRQRVEQMKSAAVTAASPESTPAQQTETLEQWGVLSAELTSSERAEVEPALAPAAQRLTRPHGAWALAGWALNHGLFEPELPVSKLLTRLASQFPTGSKIRDHVLMRRNIADFNEKEAERKSRDGSSSASVVPAKNQVRVPSETLADLLLLAEQQLTDLDRLLQPFPEQQAVIREQRHWVRNLWTVEEVARLGRSGVAVDAGSIRITFGYLDRFSADLEPDLLEAVHRLSGRSVRRWVDLDQKRIHAAVSESMAAGDMQAAYADLLALDQTMAADAQMLRQQGFTQGASVLETARVSLAMALAATEGIQKSEALASRVTADSGTAVHAELEVNQRLRIQAGLGWISRLNEARRRLLDRFSGEVERTARDRMASVNSLSFEQAEALNRSIQEGMASLSEFSDLAGRRTALSELRQQVRRRALASPQQPPAKAARFILAQDAFQTALIQDKDVRAWLRSVAEGDSPKNTGVLLPRVTRQRAKGSGITQEFYTAVENLMNPSAPEAVTPETIVEPETPPESSAISTESAAIVSEPEPEPPVVIVAPVVPEISSAAVEPVVVQELVPEPVVTSEPESPPVVIVSAPIVAVPVSTAVLPASETRWKSQEVTLLPDNYVRITTADPTDLVQMEFGGREWLGVKTYPVERINVVTSKHLIPVSGNELAAAALATGDWRQAASLLGREEKHQKAHEGEWVNNSVLVYAGVDDRFGIENEIYFLSPEDLQRMREDLTVITGSRKTGALGKQRFFEARAVRLTVRFNSEDRVGSVIPVTVFNSRQQYGSPVIGTADSLGPLPQLPKTVSSQMVSASSPVSVSAAAVVSLSPTKQKQLSRAEQIAENNNRLEQSRDPQEVAQVLLSDARFSPAIDENFRVPSEDGAGNLRSWLESVRDHKTDVNLARQLQRTRAAVDSVEGNNRQLFYQAFDSMLPFALQEAGASAAENTSAGLEEKTMPVAQFEEEYGKLLAGLNAEHLADLKHAGADSVIVIPLTGQLPLYVQGSDLLKAVRDEFAGKLGGDRFAPELITETIAWQKIGLVLKDETLDELPLNPNALPIRDSSADKINELDPVELLLEIFKSHLPSDSVHMGEMLLTDQSGQTYLVLLSA